MVTDTKEFTFDSAHQLVGYDGQCSNIHGHTYKLHVTVTGKIINNINDPKNGMIMDFKDLKTVVKSVIEPMDHAFIACGDEPLLQAMKDQNLKIKELGFKTTCENMSSYIGNEIQQALVFNGSNIRVVEIKLWETPTSFSTYTVYQ